MNRSSSTSPANPRPLRWLWRLAVLASVLLPTGFAACSEAEKCIGGYVTASGACEALCDPAKCKAGNVCVGNRCALLCSSHDDCFGVTQDCVEAVDDNSQRPVTVCELNGHQPVGGGWAKTCPLGDVECSALACPNGFECDPGACDGNPADCKPEPTICGANDPCNVGRCATSGAWCTVMLCDPAECTPFRCESDGSGDAMSYCTHDDCLSDDACPAGYYCGVRFAERDLCGATPSLAQDVHCPSPGQNPCIDAADLAPQGTANAAGQAFFQGPTCVMRSTCLKRGPCAECTDHLDCSTLPSQLCMTGQGGSQCATLCDTDVQCLRDEQCLPTGTKTCLHAATKTCVDDFDCADARCVEVDPANVALGKVCAPGGQPCLLDGDCADFCVDRSACVPRAGACRSGTLPAPFCSHCLDDTDCGGPGSNMGCRELGGSLGQPESACLDFSFANTCTTDNDCPIAQSGLHGECLDEPDGVDPNQPLYHTCYYPWSNGESVFSCWP